MAAITTTEANNILTGSLMVANGTYTAGTSPLKLALTAQGSGNTSSSTAASAGTEVTGGSYARASIPTSAFWGTVSGGSVTNSGASGGISFTNMPATTVYGIELYDSAGTPARKWFGSLTAAKTTSAGDTLSFATSSITISLT
jgi:hypothetical protein